MLSNGHYNVLLTEAGAGYGNWRGLDILRWREDGTRDCWGQFCYVRDLESGEVWTIGRQPICHADATYEHRFHGNWAEYRCFLDDIDIHWEVCVAPDCDAEVRLLNLRNRGTKARKLELTSYSEVCLSGRSADSAHPAFAKLFIETWFDADTTALFARRRPRSASERPIWALHVSASREPAQPVEYETDRYTFLGRRRTPENPIALAPGSRLSGATGPVLDPIFSLRRKVHLEPSAIQQIAFVTGAADSDVGAAAIAKRFTDIDAAHQSLLDAKKNNGASPFPSLQELAIYNRLAAHLAFSIPSSRETGATDIRRAKRSDLGAVGLSGTVPILLLHIDETADALVDEVIIAHAFIVNRGFPFDLVVLDERDSSESLQLSGKAAAHVERVLGQAGGVHFPKNENVSEGVTSAITAAARLILCCGRGPLTGQLSSISAPTSSALKEAKPNIPAAQSERQAISPESLLFWNGRGGFTKDGREYVIAADAPPTPWCNVLTNGMFGCLTSDSGLGYTWAGNSQLNRLTPWSNDPVSDAPSEVVYLRDEQTAEVWTPTPLPLGHTLATKTRHGHGYSCYESRHGTLHQEMAVHVPSSGSIKVIRLAIRNDGNKTRNLTATYFLEWVLGTLRESASARVECEFDAEIGAIVAHNIWEDGLPKTLAFAASSAPIRSFTCDRSAFLGRNGSIAQPLGLKGLDLGGHSGPHLDPCAALMVSVSIPAAQTVELVFVLGQAESREEMRRLIREHANSKGSKSSLSAVSQRWDQLLSSVTVRTPDMAFDLMINRWLLYQVLACRLWARTGFYQSGGAYGFRDQLQDVAALVHCAPEEAREHILRAASHQFTEGDVQHWWHPPTGAGVRTRMTDDLYFLPYVVEHYVSVSGDYELLNEQVPFIVSPPLTDDEEERYEVPAVSEEQWTIYEHCCRALDQGLRLGTHGLPLMGTGDWNDGMNRVGAEGKGESVWNGWFFLTVLKSFAGIASKMGDDERAAWCIGNAEALRVSLETHAWDGSWYRRAYFDDGTPLGSHLNDECQIDAIPQAWAVISGAADSERAAMAMHAVWERLVRTDNGLIQLFDPPFDKGSLQPGYIKGYVPGIRENGGQYTHAATWVALATALMGDGDRAFQLWSMLNPINHAVSPKDTDRYMVEPYVVSADVYGAAPHTGRGGWTWYTGSAGWLYRVGLEAILGIRREGRRLVVEPTIPKQWPGYDVDFRYGRSTYHIKVSRDHRLERTHYSLSVDGKVAHQSVPLVDDGRDHNIRLVIG
nr:glycosyl transferase [Ensifer sesbaniae]